AAHMLEAAGPDLTIEAGTIAVRGAPGRAVTIAEVADLAHRPSGGTLPPGVDPGLEATQYYDPPPATFTNGTHVAVVAVDPEPSPMRSRRSASRSASCRSRPIASTASSRRNAHESNEGAPLHGEHAAGGRRPGRRRAGDARREPGTDQGQDLAARLSVAHHD